MDTLGLIFFPFLNNVLEHLKEEEIKGEILLYSKSEILQKIPPHFCEDIF
jgi:hypothetical protein